MTLKAEQVNRMVAHHLHIAYNSVFKSVQDNALL